MNFVINENRLHQIIEDSLNKLIDIENLHWTEYFDEDGNPTDIAYEFYYGDHDSWDTIFRLYNKTYWSDKNDFRIPMSPILMFEEENLYNNLNSMFGDRWEPIFKKWFKEKTGFDVKTIDSY
jgi:hypothetical protein